MRGFLIGLLVGVLVGAGSAPGRSAGVTDARPASPGGVRLTINDFDEHFEWFYDATGTITVTGDPGAVTAHKIPLGYKLDVVWTESNHAWVDAQITRVE